MSGYMVHIHKLGIEITNLIQWSLQDYGGFFIWISKVFDPRHSYLLCFPLLFPFNRSAGIQVLWTTAIAEWLNHVYKWLLFGERPYWWVFINSSLWPEGEVPFIQQFSITCETGPGSPSGHVMISSAVLFVFVKGILATLPRKMLPFATVAGWIIYAITVTCISISRVYIAAHFPHQCLVGLICGVVLGYILGNAVAISQLSLKWHGIMALGTFLIAMTTYYIILGLGIDPNWTLPLAKKFCAHPEWVHLNTTPFYMLWRYTATLLGIGLALFSTHYFRTNIFQNAGLITKTILAAAGTFTALTCEGLISSASSASVVYTSEFLIHTAIPVLVMSIVPWASQAVL